MIRASIARHVSVGVAESPQVRLKPDATCDSHPSFARLPLLRSGDDEGACVIEPAVRCNHCGYCLSYGH